MSSTIRLSFKKPVTLKEWNRFCPSHDIQYNPSHEDQNVYLYSGIRGVEIFFGDSNHHELPMIGDMVDFSKATPKESATEISISSQHGGDFDKVAFIAKKIMEKWKASYSCDDKLLDACLKGNDRIPR